MFCYPIKYNSNYILIAETYPCVCDFFFFMWLLWSSGGNILKIDAHHSGSKQERLKTTQFKQEEKFKHTNKLLVRSSWMKFFFFQFLVLKVSDMLQLQSLVHQTNITQFLPCSPMFFTFKKSSFFLGWGPLSPKPPIVAALTDPGL